MQTTTDSGVDRDALTRELTAFESFDAMLGAQGNYRPTILPRDYKHVQLADAYDAAQAARGDERRAYRGVNWPLAQPILSMRLTSLCPHNKASNQCCGYPEWLQVIHAINTAAEVAADLDSGPLADDDRPFGAPLFSHEESGGRWFEEYRDFRVILVNRDVHTNYVQARTPEAADALRAAVKAVLGFEIGSNGVRV